MPHCRDCADHDGICPNNGEPCDPADVIVEVTMKEPPYAKCRMLGHRPFEMCGERFAVTPNLSPYGDVLKWCVSHIATGARVPRSGSATVQGAIREARHMLEWAGCSKLKATIYQTRKILALSDKVNAPKDGENGGSPNQQKT